MHIGFLTPEYAMPGSLDGGLANYIRKVGLALAERGHEVSAMVTTNRDARWQDHIIYMRGNSRKALWRPEYRTVVSQPCQVFEEAASRAQEWDELAYVQYLDIQTYLPCDILTKVDVASMYHGLEVRPPLVDRDVVELAASLPLAQGRSFLEEVLLDPTSQMCEWFDPEQVKRHLAAHSHTNDNSGALWLLLVLGLWLKQNPEVRSK